MGLLSFVFGSQFENVSTKADCDRLIAKLQGEIERLKADNARTKLRIKEDKKTGCDYRNLTGGIQYNLNEIAQKKARIAELRAMKSSLPKG